ncbi:MAG TPA: HAMP domain-containing sensor histidine kinase [Micromonosporaceae bacterium]
MSSSRPNRRAWTLRARLLAAVIALLAAVCVGIGVTTTVALRNQLLAQKDSQLTVMADRPPPHDDGEHGDPGPGGDDHRGQPDGTLTAILDGGTVRGAETFDADIAYPGDATTELPTGAYGVLTALPLDNRPHTRHLGALGDYRLVGLVRDGKVWIIGLPLSDVEDTLSTMVAAEAGIAGAGLLLAGAAGAWIIRRSLRPLRRVAATASRVAELPLHEGEVALAERVPDTHTDPRTEVGQVGAALNRMLGHVGSALAARQASEMRVRQFVADASHELRTPLAAIRGYAELTRRGRDPVPPDVAHALRRVESESARMSMLVDDLLLLARLDAGRPLDAAPVDLSAIVVDAVGDAHVAGPGHHWRLDLPDEAVCVRGDSTRLHQVVANLLSNARTHTPPGTTVRAALTVEGTDAILTVTDDGPGIPADLQNEVFERFARGDSSRSRAAGSTGLGLAIVAAVVGAHHGSVAVASRPGQTRFTVRLPGAQSTADRQPMPVEKISRSR